MKNDQLGRIANAHLAFAEQELQSGCTRHPSCQRLAELHSTAVDFAKTGVPVDGKAVYEITRGLTYPDYLSKSGAKSFVSTSAVGMIWRRAKELSPGHSPHCRGDGVDPALLLKGRDAFHELARGVVYEYNRRLAGIMRVYGSFHEGEVMCGHVARFAHVSRREKVFKVQVRVALECRRERRCLSVSYRA